MGAIFFLDFLRYSIKICYLLISPSYPQGVAQVL
jgi:hypothetical protein